MMTEEEFEVWLDEFSNNAAWEDGCDAVNVTKKKLCEQSARAAWQKAQNEIARLQKCADLYDVRTAERNSIKQQADKLAQALESLDQPLCERVIDPCGYNPKDETKESLVQSMLALSEKNLESLNIVRQALKEYKGGEQ